MSWHDCRRKAPRREPRRDSLPQEAQPALLRLRHQHGVLRPRVGQLPAGDATRLLRRIRSGEKAAENRLYQLLQEELRQLAQVQLNGDRHHHTLQPTALVHEAWIRLAKADGPSARDRVHFLCVAARAMRTSLVDHARRKQAVKRASVGHQRPIEEALDKTLELCAARGIDPIDLDDALERLAADEPPSAPVAPVVTSS